MASKTSSIYYCSTLGFFAVLGYYGGMLLFLSWPMAVLLGLAYRRCSYHGAPTFTAAAGIFLGGLLFWLMFGVGVIKTWPIRLLLTVSTPLFFLAGSALADVQMLIRRIRMSRGGGGSQSPTASPPTHFRGWWRKPGKRENSHLQMATYP